MNKVSIVVPVYNSSKYLNECIDSLICQTFSNLEIIFVNDCSSDNSLKILNSYKERDNRIVVISLDENKGVSNARNVGIKNSSGEFILFVDSDDYISKNYVEELLSHKKKDSLIVCNDNLNAGEYSIDNYYKKILYGEIFGGCINYLFEKNKINTEFDLDFSYMEDSIFISKEIFNYKSILVINSCHYFYRKNEESLTRSKNNISDLINNYFKALDELVKVSYENNINININKINHRKIDLIFSNIYRINNYSNLMKNLSEIKNIYIDKENMNFKDKMKYLVIKNNIFYIYFYFRLFIKSIIRRRG